MAEAEEAFEPMVLESDATNLAPKTVLVSIRRPGCIWFRPLNGRRDWNDAANWLHAEDQAFGRVPGKGNLVTLNSRQCPPDRPLVITAGTEAVCNRLCLADLAEPYAVGLRVAAGGSLACFAGGSDNDAGLILGGRGSAVLTVERGADLYAVNGMIAYNEEGAALVTNLGSMVFGSCLQIGGAGRAFFVNEGSIRANDSIVIGRYPGKRSNLIHRDGVILSKNWLLVGRSGIGTLDASAPFTTMYFSVGSTRGGHGTAILQNGATGTVTDAAYIGGRDCPLTNEFGNGTLVLRGGALAFPNVRSQPQLYIRTFRETSGTLTGYGTVAAPEKALRLANNGTVIADGFGEPRDLDLHVIVSVTNTFALDPESRVGWYAVNRGRLRFPRSWLAGSATGEVSCCLGDVRAHAAPEPVNSVRATFTGLSTRVPGVYLNGDLYASDRPDIPKGLPAGRVAGVWKLAVRTANESPTYVAFDSVRLAFHCDTHPADATRVLRLYHHTAKGWQAVGEAPGTAATLSTAAAVPRDADGAENIGWFAAVSESPEGSSFRLE